MKVLWVVVATAGLLVSYTTSAQVQGGGRSALEKSNMKRCLDFWYKVLIPLDLEKFKDYVATDYTEHYPGLEGGLDALVGFFRKQKAKNPAGGLRVVDPVVSLVDGDITLMVLPGTLLVVPRNEVQGRQPLRLEIQRWKDGKQIEHWDSDAIGAPPTTPAVHARTAVEQRNLELVVNFWHNVLEPLNTGQFKDYISEDYVEHDAAIPTGGLNALVAEMNRRKEKEPHHLPPSKFIFTLVDGDLVALMMVRLAPDDEQDATKTKKILGLDLLRVKNGKMIEHWGDVMRKSTS